MGRGASRSTERQPPEQPADDARPDTDDDAVEDAGVDPETLQQANDEDLRKLEQARRTRAVKAAVVGVVAVALITFVIQNARTIEVELLFWSVSVRLIWVIVVAAALGAVGGFIAGKPDANFRLHGPRRRRGDSPAD